jgi:hypothetical protein
MGIGFERPSREADLDLDLELRGKQVGVLGTFPCRVWIPRSEHERPALEIPTEGHV